MVQIGSKAPNGYTVIAAVPFPHEHDAHLSMVLAMRDVGEINPEYAVWDHNEQTNGFANGQYPQCDRTRAFVIFAGRIASRTQSAFGLKSNFSR